MLNWIQSLPFVNPWFFVAGVICAAGPIIIHLLNRRRYRVVHWAAMDFLREALQRNRRIMQLRDILLLMLRTAAVLLFGLALAQTSCSTSSEKFDASQPLHAILLVDNSLSMGYQSLDGALLDRAKTRAQQYIEKLPQGSQVSVIPLCGARFGGAFEPYRTKEEALEALRRIEVVDRGASLQQAANQAARASQAAPELSKRVVVFSDQQRTNWRSLASDEQWRDLPAMQLVDVGADEPANTWISDFYVQDGLADVETPTTFVVNLRHEGPEPRDDVQVTLTIDGVEAASRTVRLEPGEGVREVQFQHVFATLQPEAGQVAMAPVSVSLPADRLPGDDARHLMVPVVAALPVVFIDQYGADEEDVIRNRIGESRHLRKLLAPVARRGDVARQLVQIRHVRPEQVSEETLADARLVVVAGVSEPGSLAELLHDYVRQGGQLVLAAGAGFDPQAWTDGAWLEGDGLLPLPLGSEPVGATPAEDPTARPFFLGYDSLRHHDYFQLAGASEEDLRDLYAEPFFFKAVRIVDEEPVAAALRHRLRAPLADRAAGRDEHERRRREMLEQEAAGGLDAAQQAELDLVETDLRQLEPNWLLWAGVERRESSLPVEPLAREQALDQQADQSLPRVLARYDNGAAFLVERRIGHGRVVFCTSGLASGWNTLPQTNTFLIFDRILRGMIEATLPPRNYAAVESIVLPVAADDAQATVVLRRPGATEEQEEVLDVGFIGREQRGVTIDRPLTRGLYRVAAYAPDVSAAGEQAVLWETVLAVNGSAEESELATLTRGEFERRVGEAPLGWVGQGEEISLAGAQTRGQNWWWWFVLAVLALLLAELAILAWPLLQQQVAPRSEAAPTPTTAA